MITLLQQYLITQKQIMKQKVKMQIERLQRKYQVKRSFSLSSERSKQPRLKILPIEISQNFKTEQDEPNESLRNSRKWSSQISYKINHPYSERTLGSIGRKYFDLDVYKAQSAQGGQLKNKFNLNLPKMVPNFQTQLYSPTFLKKSHRINNQQSIKKRALQKVNEIYSIEQKIVNQKYEKIQRIKHRLKLLEKISTDKLKLRDKLLQITER